MKIEDINSLEDAEKVLGENLYIPKDTPKRWVAQMELENIIKAVNYLDNDNKIWIPDYSDNTLKYTPVFAGSGSSWSCGGYRYWYSSADTGSGLVFKRSESCKLIASKFLQSHYSKFL